MIDDLVTRAGRALPNVHQPGRVSAPAASGQCGPATDADRARSGVGQGDPLARLQAKEAQIAQTVRLLGQARAGETTLLLLRRPDVDWEDLVGFLPDLAQIPAPVVQQVVYDAKYSGYVDRQTAQIERQHRLATKRIPADFDFASVADLRAEAREKTRGSGPPIWPKLGGLAGLPRRTWPCC